MTDIYKARWDYITSMFNKLKPYVDSPEYVVIYDGEELKNLTITDKSITSIDLKTTLLGNKEFIFTFAENNKYCAYGLYISIPEWKRWFKENIKVYLAVPITWE